MDGATSASATYGYGGRQQEEKKKKLWFCVSELNPVCVLDKPYMTYKWYSIDPIEGTHGSCTEILPDLPNVPCDQPYAFGCCALGSDIYVIGGMLVTKWPDENFRHDRFYGKPNLLNRVLVCDTNSPQNGWKVATPMQAGRVFPLVDVVDGKIYAFGSNLTHYVPQAIPWGEVFDPITNKWTPLDDPHLPNGTSGSLPDCLMPLNHAIVDKKKIIMHAQQYGLKYDILSFNTESLKWEDMDPNWWPQLLPGEGRFVILDDGEDDTKHVLYALIRGNFCRCKLGLQNKPNIEYIPGLKNATESIKDKNAVGSVYPSFLFHLGDRHFCLVWAVIKKHVPSPATDDDDANMPTYFQHIHRVNFHLSTHDQSGSCVAVVDKCLTYRTAGSHLLACLELKP